MDVGGFDWTEVNDKEEEEEQQQQQQAQLTTSCHKEPTHHPNPWHCTATAHLGSSALIHVLCYLFRFYLWWAHFLFFVCVFSEQ